MSPELETLDQLLGGDLPLQVIHGLFPDQTRFVRGLSGLLHAGEVRLLAADGVDVPHWQWREVLEAPNDWPGVCVTITTAGVRRIE